MALRSTAEMVGVFFASVCRFPVYKRRKEKKFSWSRLLTNRDAGLKVCRSLRLLLCDRSQKHPGADVLTERKPLWDWNCHNESDGQEKKLLTEAPPRPPTSTTQCFRPSGRLVKLHCDPFGKTGKELSVKICCVTATNYLLKTSGNFQIKHWGY